MTPDQINGTFELCGSFFTWGNAWRLYKDGEIRGVYWPAFVFFTVWGVFNLWFYWAVELPFSWWGGVVLCSGNVAWLVLAFIVFHRKRVL